MFYFFFLLNFVFTCWFEESIKFVCILQDTFSEDKPVAIKVLHRVYKPIGSQEADILLELHRADPWLFVPFSRLQVHFQIFLALI